MLKIDHLLNRVIERRLFRFRHESRIAYAWRRIVEDAGPVLLGALVGLIIAGFLFWGI